MVKENLMSHLFFCSSIGKGDFIGCMSGTKFILNTCYAM